MWKKDNRPRRRGTASVEFAFCMPLLLTLMLGIWEIGRLTTVQQSLLSGTSEAARDASLGQTNLSAVASNLLVYLQAAQPAMFPAGHTTNMISPVISLPANATGYTCWDATAGKELFTVYFSDLTNTSVTDPTGMAQLDRYVISVSIPYANVGLFPATEITGVTRLYANAQWACMVDSPFQVTQSLPAQ